VSKRIDSTYRSGPYRARIKVRNPASIAGAAGAEREMEWVITGSGYSEKKQTIDGDKLWLNVL
jgi:hypothetical protein